MTARARVPLGLALVVLTVAFPVSTASAHVDGKAEPRIAAGIAGTGLTRTLTVRLTDLDGGGPISGATVTATASMPSPHVMRLAPWDLPPVEAGVYRARVRFVMPADWKVSIDVSGDAVVAASSTLEVPIESGAGEVPESSGVAVLPTRLADDVTGRDVWTIVVLWLHAISAVGWIVGVIVMAAALSARPGVLAERARARLADGYQRWGAWLHWGFVPVIVITGIYNMLYVTPFPIAWRPEQLDALGDVPYGPLYEAILVFKLGLFAALLVTGTQVLIRTVRPHPVDSETGLGRTFLSALGAPGIVYLACVPLILAAAAALRYVHILSHVADVVAGT